MPIRLPHWNQVVGIDFSGARLSGLNAWGSWTEVAATRDRLRLVKLSPLGKLATSDHRDDVNRFLVEQVNHSQATLWGLDFPFGLPIELKLGSWSQQLRSLARFAGDAKDYGRLLVDRSLQQGHAMHVRRLTDQQAQTPFDCYHYRIIYQTFHGMRDVLRHLHGAPTTAVLPFQYAKLCDPDSTVQRVVVEACPSSTLKRLGLPHRLYKQTAKRQPTAAQIKVRQTILATIQRWVDFTPSQRRVMLDNPGGDALDSLLAAVGVFQVMQADDHDAIAGHPRYRREGRVYG